jgi:puromycin-sensitive aminopeptidase
MPVQLQEAQKPAATKQKSFRLPDCVVPKRYEIRLAPNLETFEFAGRETIEIFVRKETDRVVLNAVDVTLS